MADTIFKDWIWAKFEEWRKGTTNGPTAFARFLEIDKQQSVSDWLNGKYKPKSQEHITKIAKKYPDVYEILDIPEPAPPPLSSESLPPEFRSRLESAMRDIANTLEARKIDPASDEAEQVAIEVMERFGFTYKSTSSE